MRGVALKVLPVAVATSIVLTPATRRRVMHLEERTVEDVIVLAPSGRMTRNESYGAVKHRLHDLVQEGRRKLLLDLAAVSYTDTVPTP